jgi:hypothetical protein
MAPFGLLAGLPHEALSRLPDALRTAVVVPGLAFPESAANRQAIRSTRRRRQFDRWLGRILGRICDGALRIGCRRRHFFPQTSASLLRTPVLGDGCYHWFAIQRGVMDQRVQGVCSADTRRLWARAHCCFTLCCVTSFNVQMRLRLLRLYRKVVPKRLVLRVRMRPLANNSMLRASQRRAAP